MISIRTVAVAALVAAALGLGPLAIALGSETAAFPSPGYATAVDPSPGEPLAWRVGAVHEHSGFSDGAPGSVPLDYFNAGRTGHNQADLGGDTGVQLDFMWGSEHVGSAPGSLLSDLECLDITGILRGEPLLDCPDPGDDTQSWKWETTLQQANEATERSADGSYTGFTAARGLEYAADDIDHLNVYFSTNIPAGGSLAGLWEWLRTPVAEGGGADGLVTFNHPGSDRGFDLTDVLGASRDEADFDDLAYVADLDERVAGIEVNGGDDLDWYVQALSKGWHLGPLASEDEHEREWASSTKGKTLVLTRGRSPRDYYYALSQHRTVAVLHPLVGGSPGERAVVPTIDFYADGTSIQDPGAVLLGSTSAAPGPHTLHVEVSGVPAGSAVALLSNTTNGRTAPVQLGLAGGDGTLRASYGAQAPAAGEDWYVAVVCTPDAAGRCGVGRGYWAVTAPIWLAAP